MTEAADFRPSEGTGELWEGQVVDVQTAAFIERVTVRGALNRLDNGSQANYGIYEELREIPAAEWAAEYDLVTDPKPTIKEASLEDKIRVLGEFEAAMVSYADRYVAGSLPPEHYERIPRIVSGDEPSLPVWLEPDVFNGERPFKRAVLATREFSAEEASVEVLDEEVVDAARDEDLIRRGEIDPDLWHDVLDKRAITD